MEDRFHISRRSLMAGAGTATGAALLTACGSSAKSSQPATPTSTTGAQFPHPADPAAALSVLQEGNARFANGELQLRDYSPAGERIAESHKPFVAIVTCADARVATPLAFDIR